MLLNFSEVFQQIWEGFIIKDQGRSQEFFQGGGLKFVSFQVGGSAPVWAWGGRRGSPP